MLVVARLHVLREKVVDFSAPLLGEVRVRLRVSKPNSEMSEALREPCLVLVAVLLGLQACDKTSR